MFHGFDSTSSSLSLEELLARLARRDEVDAILLMGSTGSGDLSAQSDYDLALVLNSLPVPIHIALAYIDGRLADVEFTTTEFVDAMLASETPFAATSYQGLLVHWLRGGRIAHDRSGRLAQLRQKTAADTWLSGPNMDAIYGAWRHINYNLKQNRRYLDSDDPLYQMAFDLRMLYSLTDLWHGYQLARGLVLRGEKSLLKYWQAHDPDYLALYTQCLHEQDRGRKYALYAQLVERTLAPLGGVVPEGQAAFGLAAGDDWQDDMPQRAFDFWERLIGE